MRNEKVKSGARIMNKITGQAYIVTAKTSGNEITAAPVDETGAYEVGSEITITPEQGICFRVTEWPVDDSIPEGYSVTDGRLMKNGEEATEQGEIYVKTIVAALPGYLLLAVRPRNDREGYIDLFTYEPERDCFNKTIRASIPTVTVERVITDENGKDSAVILSYVEKRTEEETEADTQGQDVTVTKETVTGSAVILVENRRADSYRTENEFKDLIDVDGEEGTYLVKETCSDGNILYRVISICNGDVIQNSCISAAEEVVKATSSAAYPGITLIGKDFIQNDMFTFKTPLAGQIKGSFLVDMKECGKGETKVTLANRDMETTTITRRSTPDRGYVYTIE